MNNVGTVQGTWEVMSRGERNPYLDTRICSGPCCVDGIRITKGRDSFYFKDCKDKNDFVRELHDFAPDVILSAYYLPALTGSEALTIAQEEAAHLPFILITGELGEEHSVEILKKGATYVLKDNLPKLPSILLRALR